MRGIILSLLFALTVNMTYASEVVLYQYSNRTSPQRDQGFSVYDFEAQARGDQGSYSRHVMYNGTDVSNAYFEAQMVSDQFSSVVDLGEMSCKSIVSPYPDYKHTNPTSWLLYGRNGEFDEDDSRSRLDVRLNENRYVKAPALKNHCYFVHFNDSGTQVMGIFHVKEIKSFSVIIDEMETLIVRKF